MSPSRDDAWALLCEWTQADPAPARPRGRGRGRLVRRARFTALPATSSRSGGSPASSTTSTTSASPTRTRSAAPRSSASRGYPEEVVEAILGHGDHTGIPRTSQLAQTVYACDEMTGFVIAVTLVRPNRSLDEVDVRVGRARR